jgi:hypothetical protein
MLSEKRLQDNGHIMPQTSWGFEELARKYTLVNLYN